MWLTEWQLQCHAANPKSQLFDKAYLLVRGWFDKCAVFNGFLYRIYWKIWDSSCGNTFSEIKVYF